jgi:hypothetical protein
MYAACTHAQLLRISNSISSAMEWEIDGAGKVFPVLMEARDR